MTPAACRFWPSLVLVNTSYDIPLQSGLVFMHRSGSHLFSRSRQISLTLTVAPAAVCWLLLAHERRACTRHYRALPLSRAHDSATLETDASPALAVASRL